MRCGGAESGTSARVRWPWTSDVEPAFFTIVDNLDTRAVKELVALAPAKPSETRISGSAAPAAGGLLTPTLVFR
jgi:hypothetical protein